MGKNGINPQCMILLKKPQARPGSFLDLVGGAIQSRGQAFGELELEI